MPQQHVCPNPEVSSFSVSAGTCCRQGSATALKGSISGDSFDLPLPDAILHPLERTAPSGPWVFPDPSVWRDTVRLPHCHHRVSAGYLIW